MTPLPLDQFEKLTPLGGVVQVAVGTFGQVIEAPPPIVTTVCAKEFVKKSVKNNVKSFFNNVFIRLSFFCLMYILEFIR